MLPHSLFVLRWYASLDSLRVLDVLYGTSSSDGDDGMRSNDASTNHVPNNCGRTTNSDNIPNTKDYTKRTMRRTRTNRRSAVYRRKQVR